MTKNKKKNLETRFRELKEIACLMDEDNKRPNVYAFLIDRGVSDLIAEEAQELVVNAWMDRNHKFDDVAEEEFRNLINELDNIGQYLIETRDKFERIAGTEI